MVRDVCAPQCNGAYTPHSCLQVPAEKGQPHCMSRSILELEAMCYLSVFRHLYPDQISPTGLPTGFNHISTRLTAYNGSHIPLYGTLHGPITWQPDCPDSRPHRVKSYWYVADTPGPAILGLPSSEELAVVKMNCAITDNLAHILHMLPLQQPQPSLLQSLKQPSPSGLLMTWSASFQISSRGIGRFPSEYKIWLC